MTQESQASGSAAWAVAAALSTHHAPISPEASLTCPKDTGKLNPGTWQQAENKRDPGKSAPSRATASHGPLAARCLGRGTMELKIGQEAEWPAAGNICLSRRTNTEEVTMLQDSPTVQPGENWGGGEG